MKRIRRVISITILCVMIMVSAIYAEVTVDMQEAYLELLAREQTDILDYDYQTCGDLYGTRNVFLCDVYGDETPELIYISIEYMQQDMDAMWNPAFLHIVTFENGSLRELYTGFMDKPEAAGGYCYYYLFRKEGEKTLYGYENTGDDGGTEEYYRFEVSPDYGLVKENICNLYTDGPGNVMGCFVNGMEADLDTFYGTVADLKSHTSEILVYSCRGGEYADSYVSEYGCPAMDCYTAFDYIQYRMTDELATVTTINTTAITGFASWQDAYYDFIYNGRYLHEENINPGNGLNGEVGFALWDITGERSGEIPELIVNNNADGMASACSIIYTYTPSDGKMIRVGNTDWHSIAYRAGTIADTPGLYANNFTLTKYYFLNAANDLLSNEVRMGIWDDSIADYVYEIYGETANYLYENCSTELRYYYKEEIDSMGWDAFCAGN